MCGIFGVINTKEKIDEGRVLAARDVLAHRGPDDAGIYLSPDYSHFDGIATQCDGFDSPRRAGSPDPSSLDSARDDTSTSSVQAKLRVKSGQTASQGDWRNDTSTSSVQANKEKVDSRFHGNDKARNKEENNYTVALAHRRLSIRSC